MSDNEFAEVVISDELKEIYFSRQDTLLIDTGIIYTKDYSSPAIESIKSLVNNKPELIEDHGRRLRVEKVSSNRIASLFDSISERSTISTNNLVTSDIGLANSVEPLFQEAVRKRATDIHIELHKNLTRIEIRVDDRMVELREPVKDYNYGLKIISYIINEMAEDTDESFHYSKPNNGKIYLPLSCYDRKTQSYIVRDTEWRASYIQAKDNGGQLSLRWLNSETEVLTFEEMGWESGQIKRIEKFNSSASGVLFISGQTSSGKSTVLARCITNLKRKGRSINTIEDPVEFDLGVIQTSVSQKSKSQKVMSDLANLLLRHDVDIEMRGETREKEDAMSVARKGETGQLMFSTIHTSSAAGTAHTLHELMGVPSALIAAPKLMKLWVYQTLVRQLCSNCSHTLDEANLSSVQRSEVDAWSATQKDIDISQVRFKNESGCEKCVQGERGRTAVVEMIVLDDEDRRYIANRDYLGWDKALKEKGFKSVIDHANLKIRRGELDLFTASGRVDDLIPEVPEKIYGDMLE